MNPIPQIGSSKNGLPDQEIICLYVFFPAPILSQVLESFALTTFFKTSLLSLLYFLFFLWFKSGERSLISLIDDRINQKWYQQGKIWYNNLFLFLNTAIYDILYFSCLDKQDGSWQVHFQFVGSDEILILDYYQPPPG